MNARACVTTAKGTAAIAGIHLIGADVCEIIRAILQPSPPGKIHFKAGDIRVGNIVDNGRIIDHAVVACTGSDSFEITCHGNPIIVEMIMELLAARGANLVGVEEIVKESIAAESPNAITAEAKLHQLKAATIQGVRLIANQIEIGLARTAADWLGNFDALDLDKITDQAKEILARSTTAKVIVDGCKAVIAGPPNSGKSTLLNCLAGTQKAIVTDIAGTTRDWVSATCRFGPLLVELTDTAGLDRALMKESDIDEQAQKKASQLLNDCDIILHVIDGSTTRSIEKLNTDKPILTVINKSDLGCAIDENTYLDSSSSVKVSAKNETGIEELTVKIQTVLGVTNFDSSLPVCFTERQRRLLTQLAAVNDKTSAKLLIRELLSGPVCV